jgi:hypothetical protein
MASDGIQEIYGRMARTCFLLGLSVQDADDVAEDSRDGDRREPELDRLHRPAQSALSAGARSGFPFQPENEVTLTALSWPAPAASRRRRSPK